MTPTYTARYNNALKTVYDRELRSMRAEGIRAIDRQFLGAPIQHRARRDSRQHNQLKKALRRQQMGKPSYRQRQASAHASRSKSLVPG